MAAVKANMSTTSTDIRDDNSFSDNEDPEHGSTLSASSEETPPPTQVRINKRTRDAVELEDESSSSASGDEDPSGKFPL